MKTESRQDLYLGAIAGECDAPKYKSRLEKLLNKIIARLNGFLLPKPEPADAGKVPMADSFGGYGLTSVPEVVDANFESSISIHNAPVGASQGDSVILSPDTLQGRTTVLNVEGSQSDHVVVRGVADPVISSDAANKGYVDAHGLSEATAEDAGMAPVVQDDGSYALTAVGGGGNTVIVTATQPNRQTILTDLSMTYAQIAEQINAGKNVVVHVSYINDQSGKELFVFYLASKPSGSSGSNLTFAGRFSVTTVPSGSGSTRTINFTILSIPPTGDPYFS